LFNIILTVLLVIASFILIGVVLLQSGKADAAQLFGGGGATAFGPRGTTTVLQKVTVSAAIAFMVITFLFMIGVGGPRSAASGVRERAPIQVPQPTPAPVVPDQPKPESTPNPQPQNK